MDADMMDSDAPITSSSPEASEQIEAARRLLTLARQFIDQGKPSQALQAVVMAMKSTRGEAGAFEALNRAKEVYMKKMNENNIDELASLFAECAIAEALPSISNWEPDGGGTSILTESGRKQVMVDAFSDGSSFVCLQCGGHNRKDEHFAFWCCNGDMCYDS
ncbi:uncharacterized protein LOC143621968 [Bidens hawaiensis]|uniref:uncharacterized protein LOC143621968 n=1 Tax=Bidens hawaiensis TaxID=980011 RepID=UPI00404B3731